MGSLYIGVSGLNVSQAALNTSAHNLANVDTKGFVRQQPIQTDFKYRKIGDSYASTMQKGMGADFATVKQVRDIFLDKAYRQELGRGAYYDAQYNAVQEIEGLFGELEGESFQDTMNNFWYTLQELAKEPDSVVTRASLIQTAVSFIERSENISKQLYDYQVNLNTQIKEQVNRINEIGESITHLNKKIRHYEASGVEQANDLRDERNNLLDELSQMVNITYKENSVGVVTVNVEGAVFVSEDTWFKMDTAKVDETSEMLKPVWPSHGDADVFRLDRVPSSENNTDIGSLKGLLVARGYKKANYTDIPKYNPEEETQAQYQARVAEYNRTIESSVVMSTQTQFDQLIHGIVTLVNDIFSPNQEVTLSDGTKATIFDSNNAPVGMDPAKTKGQALFTRKSMDSYGEEEIIDYITESGEKETVSSFFYNVENPDDIYSLFTIGEIQVNPDIMQNYDLIPLSDNDGSGGFDPEAVNKLMDVWHNAFSTLSPNTLTQYNFSDYYTAFTSELANRGEKYNTIGENQASMVESINNSRSEVSGVSSDEELTNLIKYQHAYNASSRYVNTVSQMLEDIINKL
jgi:flagellar hook-associated protein 1 FlgK